MDLDLSRISQTLWSSLSWRNLSLDTVRSGVVSPLRDRLALRAKVALDDAVLSMNYLATPNPTAEEWDQIVSEATDARQVWLNHGWLANPVAYHRLPPALNHVMTSRAQLRDISFSRIRFKSEYEPLADEPGRERWLGYEANRTAHAWVLRHRGHARPWLVCLHGYTMGFPFLDLEAFPTRWLFNDLGLNLIFPVLPMHGPRRLGWMSGERFLGGNWMDTIHALAQALWDVRRLLSWIRRQGNPPIGVYGLSLGGYTAALLAAIERNLSCVVLGIPAVDLCRLTRLHGQAASLTLAEQAGLCWTSLGETISSVSPLALKPRVPRARRFIFAGTQDRLVPADQVHDLWEHWEQPRIVWYQGSHLSFRWERAIADLLSEALRATLNGDGHSAGTLPVAA